MRITTTILSSASGLVLGFTISIYAWAVFARLFDQNAVHGDVTVVLVLGIFVASPLLAFFLARKTWRGEMAKWMLAALWLVALISLAVVLYTRGLPLHNTEARPVTHLTAGDHVSIGSHPMYRGPAS